MTGRVRTSSDVLREVSFNIGTSFDGHEEEWNKTFGGGYDEYAMFRSLKLTVNDDYLIFAQTHSFGLGGSDIWLLKTDAFGNELMNKTYGGAGDEWPGWILETSDTGYIFTGTTFSFGDGESDVWLVKIDSQGSIQWDLTLGGSGNEWGQQIFHTSDGGYFIAARTNSFGAGQYDNWLIKTDEMGNVIWEKTIGTRGAEWGGFLIQTSDGGYASVGYTTDAGVNDFDLQLIKMDVNGNKLWSQTYENRGMEHGHGVCQCPDGGYVLTGLTADYWGGESDIFVVKTDNRGNELWSKTIGGEYHDIGNTVILTTDNNYLITGSLDSDLCLLKLSNDGNILYSYKVGGNGDESGGDLIQLDDGDYIATGYTDSFGNGGYDAWLLKLSITENNPPNKPQRPSGPTSGKVNNEYIFTVSTTDSDGDLLYYLFDFGDGGTSFWLGPYESGEECSASHIWFEQGSYQVRVKAQDSNGAESDWSDPLPVSMPKTFPTLLLRFLQKNILFWLVGGYK
jgi:hypothetical protein